MQYPTHCCTKTQSQCNDGMQIKQDDDEEASKDSVQLIRM